MAHEYGLGTDYDAELAFADRLVADVLDSLPGRRRARRDRRPRPGARRDRIMAPDPEVLSHVRLQSGEGRFRWLHAVPGHDVAGGGVPPR